MNFRRFNMKWLLICLVVLLIAGYHGHRSHVEAQPVEEKSPSPLFAPSDQESFWENIDTHWGGRLKTTGTVSRVTDDTVFEPVGTGTYYDGSANFRLKNETFFTDSVYSEIHYELIWAGGDLIRKQNELKEAFPDIPENFFFAGTALSDDRRLMDLTDTIKEEDSWFLLQRLDRLYLALLGDRGSVRIGRQAITWGNGFIFNPMDLFNPFPPTAVDRDYKLGDDMINAQFSLAQLGDVQLLYVARRNPNSNKVSVDQASAAGKLHFAVGTSEFDILGSRHFEDNVVGIGSRGYLGDTAWRLEKELLRVYRVLFQRPGQ
jgi:hypothetical protein